MILIKSRAVLRIYYTIINIGNLKKSIKISIENLGKYFDDDNNEEIYIGQDVLNVLSDALND